MNARLAVKKTYKLFIGGKFPRSESGRVLAYQGAKAGTLANIARGSRKDLRDAVTAAAAAQPAWQKATPCLRGQILYRIAEMLETRIHALVGEIVAQTGESAVRARREVECCVDRLVWYAGWADKFVQCFGAVNPVALPFFNITVPEPMGVVGLVAANDTPLVGLVSKLAPAIVSGNAVVVLASELYPLSAISFAEVLATADLPGGVVNILTGQRKELLPVLAKHMGVAGIDYSGTDAAEILLLRQESAENCKRLAFCRNTREAWLRDDRGQDAYWITALCDAKTAWHPIGV